MNTWVYVCGGGECLPMDLGKDQENMKNEDILGEMPFQLNISISKSAHLGPESYMTSIIPAGTLYV